jgi:pantothenate kinase
MTTKQLDDLGCAGQFGASYTAFFDSVVSAIRHKQSGRSRIIVGVAGPPAGGKTTMAENLVSTLNAQLPDTAALVPMDGFHLDNVVLEAAGLLNRKGAPQTFDVEGFYALLTRVRDAEHDQFTPTFDRARDIAIAGARRVSAQHPVIVVEGNYLLLDHGKWPKITALFDHTVFVEAPLEALEQRLVQRWRDNGYDETGALERAQSNDIPNAQLVISQSVEANQKFCQMPTQNDEGISP